MKYVSVPKNEIKNCFCFKLISNWIESSYYELSNVKSHTEKMLPISPIKCKHNVDTNLFPKCIHDAFLCIFISNSSSCRTMLIFFNVNQFKMKNKLPINQINTVSYQNRFFLEHNVDAFDFRFLLSHSQDIRVLIIFIHANFRVIIDFLKEKYTYDSISWLLSIDY